jgi:excisionase family DNA binding protein
MEKDFLTKREVQEYLRISRGTVDKLMRHRDLPYIKIGKKVLFSKDDINAFMNARKITLTPKKPSKRP